MNKAVFIKLAIIVTFHGGNVEASSDDDAKPNFIFILADDLGNRDFIQRIIHLVIRKEGVLVI